MLARIIDGQLQLGLQQSGERIDGRTVSNYNLLPEEDLRADGWKETADDYTNGTEYISGFHDTGDKIVLEYSNETGL